MKRAAFVVTPYAGGVFSVFVSMRAALAEHGVDLRWVGYSSDPEELRRDAALAKYMDQGHLVDARGLDAVALGKGILKQLLENHFELVFVNVLTSAAEMSAVAYLPPEVRRVMIVHNITPGTFSAARAIGPYVDYSVGVCPRISEHLVKRMGLPAERVGCIPNAVETGRFAQQRRVEFGLPLRLLSLGRVVDTDKGVFWLPEIMRQLREVDVRLTVAGEGPDLEALKRRCADVGDRVEFVGRVAGTDVPALVASHHVFVMTSRFEGLPYSLIETMAGGCVPVASRIRGVTDFVVREGETGLLFGMGDVAAAAAGIRRLAGDEALHARLSQAAKADVWERFSIGALSAGYGELLGKLKAGNFAGGKTHFGQEFGLVPIGGGWRRWVPNSVKNMIRKRLYA